MRLRRKHLPVSVEGNERYTKRNLLKRVEARAGSELCEFPLRSGCLQRDEDRHEEKK